MLIKITLVVLEKRQNSLPWPPLEKTDFTLG